MIKYYKRDNPEMFKSMGWSDSIDAFNYVLDGFTIVGKRLYSHNGMRFCRYVWDEQQTANKQDDAK